MKKFLVLLLFPTVLFAQKPVFTTAKVKNVTVYFNSAEISQTTSATLPKGTSEIVIKNVADYLNENTVQIGAPSNVTVLSVQFTNNYISEYEIDENSPAIKKVRDSIKLVENYRIARQKPTSFRFKFGFKCTRINENGRFLQNYTKRP